jgi:hypothetical protein
MTLKTEIHTAMVKYDIVDLSIAGISGLAFAFVTLFLCIVPLTNIAGARDFVAYWATGQQLVHHANPYDAEAMTRIEHAAGLTAGYSVGYMRNPPWGLILAFPLGFIGLRAGAFLWSLLLLACLTGSVLMLWRMHGRPANPLHWLGLSFAPALLCLTMGQTTLFALLGYVLFLRLHRSQPFLAGVSLWLCMLKPHLFLPIGVVMLAWVLVARCYKCLAGVTLATAASCALTFCIDPAAWSQYALMMRTVGIEKEFIPCLSIVLRLWVSPGTTALQYLPAALGCAWALGYFWKRRHAWEWMKDGSLLMLVSLFTAPYCWLFDQGLAIPALLEGAYLTRLRPLLAALAAASLLIEIELISNVKVASVLYLWTAPAWLAWYLLAVKFKQEQAEGIE